MKKGSIFRVVTAGLAAVATLLPLSACGSAQKSAEKKDVVISAPTNATTALTINYNPFSSLALTGTNGGLYEGLFFCNSYGTKGLEPLLGTSYKMSQDAKSIQINLRKNVVWSDGQPFTADDVVYTFDLLSKNSALNTVGFHGRASKINENEVRLDFDQPQSANGFTFLTTVYIVPKHDWEKKKDPVSDTNEKAVGSGPLTVEGGNFSSMSYTLKRNKHYWDKGKPKIAGIRYIVYSNTQSQQDALLAGQLDWANLNIVNADQVLSSKPAIKQVNLPSSQVSLITCSNAELGCKGPITDPAVRKAIYYGIDRGQLNKLSFNNSYLKINGSLYPTEQYEKYFDKSVEDSPVPMKARADKAEQILKDAGYSKGSDGLYQKDGQPLSFEVAVTNGTSDWISAIDVANQQLKKIGIELKTKQVSSNEWGQGLRKGDYDLTIYGLWLPNATEAWNFYNQWFNGAKTAPKGQTAYPGYARYNNETVNKALETINSTTDSAVKKKAYSQIQKQVFEDMPYIPLLRQGGQVQTWTDKVNGYPTKDNLYANPQTWANPDLGIVIKNLNLK